MRPFLLGISLIYALAAGIVLYLDDAVRINNPWVLSFILCVVVVPIAASWGAAELVNLIFRRGILDPGRSHVAWRFARGLCAGILGVLTTLVLVVMVQVKWQDWYTMAAAAAPWSALFALIGRSARKAHLCATCGYDLRGLTTAANGRCPECGQHAHHTPGMSESASESRGYTAPVPSTFGASPNAGAVAKGA